MYDIEKPNYRKYPKVPIDRRIGAFVIDFLTVWFISSFFASNIFFQWLVFIPAWLIMRVLISEKNWGQSLGRWAFDIKVIDPRFNRLPDILSLSKREIVLAVGSALAISGLQINFRNGLSMLLLLAPLLIDCSLAFLDEETNLAGHDRLAKTYLVQTERGFSLDLRMKKIFGQIQRRMRK
ncbi:RDD domain containing protein [Chondrocystis sp. NIES-4102]|nr:RDD domain containing protein [Chondrocystis sp. NIES-4102]